MTIANLITGFRLLPFALFIFFTHQEQVIPAAVMFLIAWSLDAVDGLAARQLHQETSFGYVFDKAVDRLVLVGAIFVLITLGLAPLWALLLITKDVLIIPAVVRQGAQGNDFIGLGPAGRFFSVLQGLAVVWLILEWPGAGAAVVATAMLGLVVGKQYLRMLKTV